MATKVLIVDDHPAVCEGLAVRISTQPDMEVCGQAADAAEALASIAANRPDVAVVDIQLKGGDGLDLIARIKAHCPSIRILVCSMYPDALYARRALCAGALGYVNKEQSTVHVVEAIRSVRDGQIYLDKEMTQQLLNQAVGGAKTRKALGADSLSDRELQVFRYIGQGLSIAQIAHTLHRSSHTVESHRQSIKRKLNLKTANELNRAAMQWTLENG